MRKIFLCFLVCTAALTTKAQTIANAPSTSAVKWYTIEEAQALNAKAPRKFFIDMYTDWCGWCKVMDNKTFSQPDIAQYLNTYFYPVKFDAEGKAPAIFADQTFNYNAQYRCHELAATLMQGKMNYPTVVFLYENLHLLTIVPGYLAPENLRPILVFFAQNHYQNMSWEDFLKQWPDILKR